MFIILIAVLCVVGAYIFIILGHVWSGVIMVSVGLGIIGLDFIRFGMVRRKAQRESAVTLDGLRAACMDIHEEED